MGWDGTCRFEEAIDDGWVKIGVVDIQNLVRNVRDLAVLLGSPDVGHLEASDMAAPFLASANCEGWDHQAGTLDWNDFATRQDEDSEAWPFRAVDEIVNLIFDLGLHELALTLQEPNCEIRGKIDVYW